MKLFINFCFQSLLKTVTACCQTERSGPCSVCCQLGLYKKTWLIDWLIDWLIEWQIQRGAWGSAHIAVLLNNACARSVRKWLRRSSGHPALLCTFESAWEVMGHVWGVMHELFESWIESRAGEDMGQFSASPINIAAQSFRKRSRECVKVGGEIILSCWRVYS